MAQKIKRYTNPFLSAKAALATPASQVISNLKGAIALQRQGKIGQAEAIYRQILELDPKNADCLNLLGLISHQTANYQDAVELIGVKQ